MKVSAWGCTRCDETWPEHPAWGVDCPFSGCGAEAGEPCDTTRPDLAHSQRHRIVDGLGPCPDGFSDRTVHQLRPLPDQREAFA